MSYHVYELSYLCIVVSINYCVYELECLWIDCYVHELSCLWIIVSMNYLNYRVFFLNSGFYDLALIQSFFEIFEIGRTFFHSIYRRIFKNAKTLIIRQILVWKNFPQSWPFIFYYLYFTLWWILSNQMNTYAWACIL